MFFNKIIFNNNNFQYNKFFVEITTVKKNKSYLLFVVAILENVDGGEGGREHCTNNFQ